MGCVSRASSAQTSPRRTSLSACSAATSRSAGPPPGCGPGPRSGNAVAPGTGRWEVRVRPDERFQPADKDAIALPAGWRASAVGQSGRTWPATPGRRAEGDVPAALAPRPPAPQTKAVGQVIQDLAPLIVPADHPAPAGHDIQGVGVPGVDADGLPAALPDEGRPVKVGRAPGLDQRPAGETELGAVGERGSMSRSRSSSAAMAGLLCRGRPSASRTGRPNSAAIWRTRAR